MVLAVDERRSPAASTNGYASSRATGVGSAARRVELLEQGRDDEVDLAVGREQTLHRLVVVVGGEDDPGRVGEDVVEQGVAELVTALDRRRAADRRIPEPGGLLGEAPDRCGAGSVDAVGGGERRAERLVEDDREQLAEVGVVDHELEQRRGVLGAAGFVPRR